MCDCNVSSCWKFKDREEKNEKVLGITPQRMLHHTNLEQYCIALEDLENIFSPLLN